MILQPLFSRAGMVCFLLLNSFAAYAQIDGRDPTVAPSENAAAASLPAGVEGMTVMVRDGKPHLVVGTRWYAVGDKVGIMRVDRITETEVWLHDGVKLIKIARFTGIVRTAIVAKPVCVATPTPVAAAPSETATPTLSAEAMRAIGNARNDRTPFGAEPSKSGAHKVKKSKKAATNVVDPAPNPLPAVAPCEDTPS